MTTIVSVDAVATLSPANTRQHKPPHADDSNGPLYYQYSHWIVFSLFTAYMYNGTEFLAYEYWIPLPGIGYVRWDLALMGSCIEGYCLHRLWCWRPRQRRVLAACTVLVTLLLVMGYLFLPRPPYFWTRSPVLFQYMDTEYPEDSFVPNNHMTIHDGGLTRRQSHALAHRIYQHRANWTHITTACGLAHAYYGTWLDEKHDDDRLPLYSLCHGFGHYTMERAARERLFRLHFPQHMQQVQEQIRQHILPIVRPLYAHAVNASSETQIVFGDEYGLGLPTVLIQMPHRWAHWWVHPQTNTVYQRRFQEEVMTMRTNASDSDACHLLNHPQDHRHHHHHQVQTFLLPLIIPYGAGIRQWTTTTTTTTSQHSLSKQDYSFRHGKLYQYPVSTVHALLSSSSTFVPEWRDRGIFMVLEALAVPCHDGRWIFFH